MNYTFDKLSVKVSDSRAAMGALVALEVASCIDRLLADQEQVNIIFAAAPSQLDFYRSLLQHPIAWGRVNAFHMDEYIGLSSTAEQSFRAYLREHVFQHIPLKSVHYIGGDAPDLQEECHRYTALLDRFPTDIVCMGIGENTHLAFNDPPVADFQDPLRIKSVLLDHACRQQQVNDGCFDSLDDVPTRALTLTIPTLMKGRYVFCTVPGSQKAAAVAHTLFQPIQALYPSTILRSHPAATLYLDQHSASAIDPLTSIAYA